MSVFSINDSEWYTRIPAGPGAPGIVNAIVVPKGRYGRTKEISISVPIEETEAVLLSDSRLGDIDDVQPFMQQARFDS